MFQEPVHPYADATPVLRAPILNAGEWRVIVAALKSFPEPAEVSADVHRQAHHLALRLERAFNKATLMHGYVTSEGEE
jgi:hypothetical protein